MFVGLIYSWCLGSNLVCNSSHPLIDSVALESNGLANRDGWNGISCISVSYLSGAGARAFGGCCIRRIGLGMNRDFISLEAR